MKKTTENKNNGEIKNSHCLGPVSSLEDFVSPNWWRKIFNSFYLKTDGDVIEDYNITSKEIDVFSKKSITSLLLSFCKKQEIDIYLLPVF